MDGLMIKEGKYDIVVTQGTGLYSLPCGPDYIIYDVGKPYYVNYAMEAGGLVIKRVVSLFDTGDLEIYGVVKKEYEGQYLYDNINVSCAFTGTMTIGADYQYLKRGFEWLDAKPWEYRKILLATFEEGCLKDTVDISADAEACRTFYEDICTWERNPWELKRRTAIKGILGQWDELIKRNSLDKSWKYPSDYDNYEVMQQVKPFDISRVEQEKELKIPPFLRKK